MHKQTKQLKKVKAVLTGHKAVNALTTIPDQDQTRAANGYLNESFNSSALWPRIHYEVMTSDTLISLFVISFTVRLTHSQLRHSANKSSITLHSILRLSFHAGPHSTIYQSVIALSIPFKPDHFLNWHQLLPFVTMETGHTSTTNLEKTYIDDLTPQDSLIISDDPTNGVILREDLVFDDTHGSVTMSDAQLISLALNEVARK